MIESVAPFLRIGRGAAAATSPRACFSVEGAGSAIALRIAPEVGLSPISAVTRRYGRRRRRRRAARLPASDRRRTAGDDPPAARAPGARARQEDGRRGDGRG